MKSRLLRLSGLGVVNAVTLAGQKPAYCQEAGNLNAGAVPDGWLAGNIAHPNQSWLSGGNTGTTPGVNVPGTPDHQPLELIVSGTRALCLEPHTNRSSMIGSFSARLVGVSCNGPTIRGRSTLSYGNFIVASYATTAGSRRNNIDPGTHQGQLAGALATISATTQPIPPWQEVTSISSAAAPPAVRFGGLQQRNPGKLDPGHKSPGAV